MGAASKIEGGFLLERFDELDQVAFIRPASGQQMHVVRHDAICVNEERAYSGVFSQARNEPGRDVRVCA